MEDENWWWGGKGEEEGWFPASYVRLRVVQEIENDESIILPIKQKTNKMSVIGLHNKANETDRSLTVRAKCVEELITTELDYLKLLKNVIEGYLHKIREDNLFSKEDCDVIFGNIEKLFEFHQNFVQDLQDAIDNDAMENSNVGDVFLKHESGFEIYSHYCNNQPRSSARLSMLNKNKKVDFFLESCRLRQKMIRLSLDGFLLSPVQRICKYPLQLKELLKHTKPTHPDFKSLQKARTCMQNVASLINERKRRLENVNKLARWQLTIVNWKDEDLVIKSSDIIHKGMLNKIHNGKKVERYVYMFDHQFIYFKRDNSKRFPLTYRGRIILDDTIIVKTIQDDSLTVDGEKVPFSWKIWNNKKKKWCYFSTDSSEQKEQWLKAFQLERNYVREEEQKGFIVLPEVRTASMENAYNKHMAEMKRKKMRRKSLNTIPVDVDLTPPYVNKGKSKSELDQPYKVSSLTKTPPAITPPSPQPPAFTPAAAAVQKRTNRPWRNRSFRLSLQGTIFDKYVQQK